MPKYIYLMNSGRTTLPRGVCDIWNIDLPLLQSSRLHVKLVAEHLKMTKGVTFSAYWYAPLVRSRQTCMLLREYARSTAPLRLQSWLGPALVPEWNRNYNAWRRDQVDPQNPPTIDHADYARLWPSLCESEGARVLRGMTEIIHYLKDGQTALAVSSNPLIRLAQRAAFGKIESAEPGECQAIKFTWWDKGFSSCELLPR